MNILLFQLDQLAWRALSVYGGSAATPAIDSLADSGTVAEACYCPFPLCQPSRAALWTGRHSHRNRVWSNGRQWPVTPIDESFPCLGETFAKAGWDTRHFGKKHDGGALRGFTCSEEKEKKIPDDNPFFPYNMDTYADAYTMDEALSFIGSHGFEKPLLMVVDFINPHNICGWIGLNKGKHSSPLPSEGLPPLPPNFDFPDIAARPLPVQYLCCSHVRQAQTAGWTRDDFRRYVAAYNHYLSKADEMVGQVLDAFRARGKLDDTLVVLTSDHGDNMASRMSVTKQVTLYEEVTRVPLIFSGKGVEKGFAKGICSTLDLFPTLCSIANIEPPGGLDGVDISSALHGGPLPEREYVASEWFTEWGYTISPGRMIRSGKWKYMRYLEGDGEELYDLETDPGETLNLAEDPSHANSLARMREKLDKYVRETDDPFFTLEVKADKRWRSHDPGYQNHQGPSAPEWKE